MVSDVLSHTSEVHCFYVIQTRHKFEYLDHITFDTVIAENW